MSKSPKVLVLKTLIKLQKNEKGMSAVEMMLAVAIAGIVMGSIAAFLTAHIKSFETTIDVIDVQFEGQLAFNALGETAMESMGLGYVEDSTGGVAVFTSIPGLEIVNPNAIGFINADDTKVLFVYDDANDKIVFRDAIAASESNPYDHSDISDKSIWFDFAYNIDSWSIGSGVGNNSYKNTDNMYIYMELQDGDVYMNLSNLFQFRNKVN